MNYLNDETGEIVLIEDYLSNSEALFRQLIDKSDFRRERIKIFGKEILQPRLIAFYGDSGVGYTYSRKTLYALPWYSELKELKEKIEKDYSLQFNSALINYYRDGDDSMGLHADDEKELGKNPIIAGMNFGATRSIVFRRNAGTEKIKIELPNGSLLLMKGAIQHNWKHEVPKQKSVLQPRLNITFRNIITS